MADPSKVGDIRALTNHINIAAALRWTLRMFHREPVIVVSLVLATAGIYFYGLVFTKGPLLVLAVNPEDPVRKLELKKAVYGDSGFFHFSVNIYVLAAPSS